MGGSVWKWWASYWGKQRPFNWQAWCDIGVPPAKSSQLERWHLYNLQQQAHLNVLAKWLAEAASVKWRTRAHVAISSTWIDGKPGATFQNSASGKKVTCELGDLLVIVTQRRRASRTRQALLVQAKCTDTVSDLDNTSVGTGNRNPTQKQRNFYEAHAGGFTVDYGGKQHSYNIASAPEFLRAHARYLLIPRKRLTAHPWQLATLPYQCLWPHSRSTTGGATLHVADVILTLAGLRHAQLGACPDRKDDWSALVKHLLSHAANQKTRGSHHGRVSAHLSASARAQAPAGALSVFVPSSMPRFLVALLSPFCLRFGDESPSAARPDDPPDRKFYVLRIAVSDESISSEGLATFDGPD